jgi:hypothetical protein
MKIVITDSMKRHPLHKSYRRHLIAKVLGCCVVLPPFFAIYFLIIIAGVACITSGGPPLLAATCFVAALTLPAVISVFRSEFKDLRWRFKCAVKFACSHPGVRIRSIFDEEIYVPPLLD